MANNCPQKTISSDITGLSYAREKCLNELPDNPIWNPLEPNSIDSFGATITTATRTPIGSGRQRIKGEITDLEAAGGYTTDLTSHNHQDFMEGFLLADSRKVFELRNDGATPQITDFTDNVVTVSTVGQVSPGDLLIVLDSGVPGADGVREVTDVDSAAKTITFKIEAGQVGVPNAGTNRTLHIKVVGHRSAKGEVTMSVANGIYSLTDTTGYGNNLTGIIQAGDWVYVHGLKAFQGFARVASASGNTVTFDRILGAVDTLASEADSTCELYVSTSIRNPDKFEDMRFHSFQLEQTLGADKDGTQARYITGAMANEFTLTVPSADKVTAQFGFVACDEETRTGQEGVKTGERKPLITYPMFNGSNTSNRVWLHVDGEAEPLFTYATQATVTINNNMTGVKAIGVEGNLDINVGTFDVGGSVTAYFLDLRAVRAMRSNADVGGTVALMGRNTAVLFDMPKMGLSNGATAIEPNTPVTIAIDMEAVRNELNYTLQYCYFAFLPTPTKK
ncbi:putative tail tube protein [Stenotrophomonas phage BUCT627]|uniref:Tail tube protein n=1 Tax=Stenotrophomonas phage BUCT627 TaxID=2860377 RepID=A0AC61NL98_9CAUD|nr:putative tail tube protein [Stenotrophomonas phage BUCT627]QYC96684.1 putative tail tube protein [Stenotrophomonas phage BUCT627]